MCARVAGNLYVRRLSFGASPPRVRGVRTIGRYASTCRRSRSLEAVPPPSQGRTDEHSSADEAYDLDPSEVTAAASDAVRAVIRGGGALWNAVRAWAGSVVGSHSGYDTHAAASSAKGEHEVVPCERVIVDVEASYLSSDLDVLFSLRRGSERTPLLAPRSASSLQSLFGGGGSSADEIDAAVTGEGASTGTTRTITAAVSEVAISGTIRLDAEVLDEYPFLGNATVLLGWDGMGCVCVCVGNGHTVC